MSPKITIVTKHRDRGSKNRHRVNKNRYRVTKSSQNQVLLKL